MISKFLLVLWLSVLGGLTTEGRKVDIQVPSAIRSGRQAYEFPNVQRESPYQQDDGASKTWSALDDQFLLRRLLSEQGQPRKINSPIAVILLVGVPRTEDQSFDIEDQIMYRNLKKEDAEKIKKYEAMEEPKKYEAIEEPKKYGDVEEPKQEEDEGPKKAETVEELKEDEDIEELQENAIADLYSETEEVKFDILNDLDDEKKVDVKNVFLRFWDWFVGLFSSGDDEEDEANEYKKLEKPEQDESENLDGNKYQDLISKMWKKKQREKAMRISKEIVERRLQLESKKKKKGKQTFQKTKKNRGRQKGKKGDTSKKRKLGSRKEEKKALVLESLKKGIFQPEKQGKGLSEPGSQEKITFQPETQKKGFLVPEIQEKQVFGQETQEKTFLGPETQQKYSVLPGMQEKQVFGHETQEKTFFGPETQQKYSFRPEMQEKDYFGPEPRERPFYETQQKQSFGPGMQVKQRFGPESQQKIAFGPETQQKKYPFQYWPAYMQQEKNVRLEPSENMANWYGDYWEYV